MKKQNTKHAKDNWQAWVSIKWKSGTPLDAWKGWEKNKLIKGAWTTTGDWDCSLWVNCHTPGQLEHFVWDIVRANQWVSATETHWVKQWW